MSYSASTMGLPVLRHSSAGGGGGGGEGGGRFARGFAQAVNKKEKRSQANEGKRAAEHPHFVAQKGLDLLCREKCHTHRQDGRQQSASSRENQCGATVTGQ